MRDCTHWVEHEQPVPPEMLDFCHQPAVPKVVYVYVCGNTSRFLV